MAKKKQSFWGMGLILVFLGVGLLGLWGWYKLQSRAVGGVDVSKVFVIRKGESITSMGERLKGDGLIRSTVAFRILVKQKSLETKIQAGSFRLSAAMDLSEIAETLTVGRQDIWVTVLEGWRREEIAEALEVAFSDVGGVFDQELFLASTVGKEGFLFPDTYLFPMDATEEVVAGIMELTFERKIASLKEDIASSGRTLIQIITMASLIEREARDEESRPIVAGILWKRLDNDWGLEVDATLQYAKGYDSVQKTWWKPPLAADKQINSPYNTYRFAGLPPGPIAAPSLSSIRAAVHPESSDYWFYLTDNRGEMRYGRTIEEHNNNIDAYLR